MAEYVDPGDQAKGKKRRPAPAAPAEQFDAFAQPVLETPTSAIRKMVRPTDSLESQRAAVDVRNGLSEKQEFVLALFAAHGPMTDHELEHLPEAMVLVGGVRKYSETTLSKRRTELFQMGRIVKLEGIRRDRKSVWELANLVPLQRWLRPVRMVSNPNLTTGFPDPPWWHK